MSVDRAGETEAELVDRRMAEAEARWRENDARMTRTVPASVAGSYSPQDIANGRGT